jgi:hypothetical protein
MLYIEKSTSLIVRTLALYKCNEIFTLEALETPLYYFLFIRWLLCLHTNCLH